MTDPLSVAASIAGLTSLALELTKGAYGCYKYYKSVKDAKGQIHEVINQLNSLRAQLQDLEGIVARASQPLSSTQRILDTVEECSRDIEHFCKLLDPDFRGLSGTLRQLKWPTKREMVNSFVAKIRVYQDIFESAKLSDALRLTDEAVSLGKQTVRLLELERQRTTKSEQEEVWRSFLQWLSPLDVNELETLQEDIYMSRRAEHSSTWILRENYFKSWCDSKKGHLWCYGDPGVGKTVICSVIINHCKKQEKRRNMHLAYFYCNFQAERIQTTEYVIGSLLKQLVSKSYSYETLPHLARNIYERHRTQRISLQTLKLLMKSVCASLGKVHVVIDGLDELSSVTQADIITSFGLSAGFGSYYEASVLLCSRPHLRQVMISRKLKVNPQDTDMRSLVKRRMSTDPNIQRIIDGDRIWAGRVAAEICRRSSGLPLLAQLHLSSIAEVSTKADALDRVRALKLNVLDQYDQNLARIKANPAFADLAFRTFTWLLSAHRPLSTNELCEALGIGLHDESFRPDRAPSLDSVLESCLGLVKVNKPLNTVEFCHFSVKEHLIRRNHAEEIVIVDVSLSCLRYLRFADFSSLCSDGQSLQQRQDRYPLASYLSEHWASHVRGERENELGVQVGAFLGSINVVSSLQLLPDTLRNARLIGTVADMHVDSPPSKQTALYLCTYFSLATVIDTVFDKEVSADFCVPWGQRYSPAHVAVCYGDVDLLQKILTHTDGKGVRDRWGLTPLHLAVRLQSTEEVILVRTLLNNAADLESVDRDDDTALHLAVSFATTDSIEMLLRAGANVNAQNKRGRTPLHRAIERDSLLITEMLLKYHANATVLDTDGKSPLGLALETAQLTFINVLTAARDKEGHNYDFAPVEEAAAEGFMSLKDDEVQAEKEKQERLEREREENERRRRAQHCGATITELSWAAAKGDCDGLERLIQAGADINKQDPVTGKTALHQAIQNRRSCSVFWLADAGADVCIQDTNGKTPLDFIQGNRDIEWQLFHGGAIATRPSDPIIASVPATDPRDPLNRRDRSSNRLYRGRHYVKPVNPYGFPKHQDGLRRGEILSKGGELGGVKAHVECLLVGNGARQRVQDAESDGNEP